MRGGPRCVEHGLSTGPDGRCALCRRGAQPQPQPRAAAAHDGNQGSLLASVLCAVCLGALAWLALQEQPTVQPAALALEPQPAAESTRQPTAQQAQTQTATAGTGALDGESEAGAEPVAPAATQAADKSSQTEHQRRLARQIEQLRVEQAAIAERQRAREQAASQADDPRIALGEKARAEREADAEKRREKREQAAAAAARKNVSIVMYSTAWCGACKMARRYMDAQGIVYAEHDIEQSPSARAARDRLNPRLSVPTIDVDGSVMIGFSEGRLESLIAAAVQRRGGGG